MAVLDKTKQIETAEILFSFCFYPLAVAVGALQMTYEPALICSGCVYHEANLGP